MVFSFPYRGAAEEWSQLYHLDDDFSDATDFSSTWDALWTALAPCLSSYVVLNTVYGYHDTDDDAAYSYDAHGSVGGTFSAGAGDIEVPGDCAVWCRWYTERHTSTGRKIYLRKYFHGVWADASSAPDVIAPTLKTALQTFATNATGTGWHGKHLAGPDGNVPGGGSAVSSYIGFRQLKRR